MNKTKFYTIQLIFIIIFALTESCKKPSNEIQPQDITGYWRWICTYYQGPLSPTNPGTPQNSGNQEILVFLRNHTWYKNLNSIKVDSGEYYLGHISRLLDGMYNFTYDSIAYFRNGIPVDGGVDYYKIYGDSLHFTPYYGGRFVSYTFPYNGGKYWIRE
jgi:hypothetical protein